MINFSINGTIKSFSVRFTLTGLDSSKIKAENGKLSDSLFENKDEQAFANTLSGEVSNVLNYAGIATKTLKSYFNESDPIKAVSIF